MEVHSQSGISEWKCIPEWNIDLMAPIIMGFRILTTYTFSMLALEVIFYRQCLCLNCVIPFLPCFAFSYTLCLWPRFAPTVWATSPCKTTNFGHPFFLHHTKLNNYLWGSSIILSKHAERHWQASGLNAHLFWGGRCSYTKSSAYLHGWVAQPVPWPLGGCSCLASHLTLNTGTPHYEIYSAPIKLKDWNFLYFTFQLSVYVLLFCSIWVQVLKDKLLALPLDHLLLYINITRWLSEGEYRRKYVRHRTSLLI